MAQTKDSVYLKEKIAQEEARLAALAAKKTDPNSQTPYIPQGETIDVLVPSFQKPGELYYIVRDTKESIKKVCGNVDAAGLAKIGCLPLDADIGAATKIKNKYATDKYPRVQIVHGIGTPTRQTTAWGTSWIKDYSEESDGQSHRLIPFGFNPALTGTPSFDDVYDWFLAQFKQTTPEGPLASVLGTNGRASLILGKNDVIASIKRG
ncbi:MAG: hypothetical protein F6K54_24265 [Okeania sp. SIO3B5]|uniref:hypothetical protein n=1 Tax=Okeania sp. SIO3B5 TaxID=2607811 RepID=UPI0013FF68BF|nr:hypothetical protein [Okeania sp. SIO3B5]NEO55905.1 hypothetical protein [Okeania sp. SIO3B5]